MSERKVLISNFLSLSVLQGSNYLLPLITLPYLVRVLGAENFGLVAFAQALTMYFIVLTDYGFNYSATREISVNRNDNARVSEIFSCVAAIKFMLTALSFLLLSAVVFGVAKFRQCPQIYFLSFGAVIGQVLFPIWFFQGIEKMKNIAALNITAKLIFTFSIFIFVRQQGDYLFVPLLNSLGQIFAGIVGLAVVLWRYKIRLRIPQLNVLKREFVNGWYIFISMIAVNIYTTSNIVILGLFTNSTIVGYYAAGEKIVRAVQGLQIPLSRSIYPYISKLAVQSKETALSFLDKVTKYVGWFTFFISLVLFILAGKVSAILLGSGYAESVLVITILAPLPFIIGLSDIFGVQIMLNFGLESTFTKILTAAAVFDIILAVILVRPFGHIGISVTVLMTEMLVTAMMAVSLHKKGLIKIFRRN